MIRLVALDVDGTLLDSRGRVSAANRDALAEVARRGVHLAVVTGRNYPFALQAVEALPDPLNVICYNGAVTRQRGGETARVRHLDAGVARRLLVATRHWRDSTLMQFNRDGEGQTVVDRLSWEPANRRGYYERISAYVRRVDDLEHALDDDAPVQVAFNGSCADMATLLAELRAVDDAAALAVSITTYPARDFTLVDVNAAAATKGQALADAARRLGIAHDEVFAIGDNHNDIDMLRWAGTAVVMGNAEPELLGMGLPLTTSNDEDGLAQALETHVLGAGRGTPSP